MAHNKTGFNYYSVDTDRYLDIRIKRLKKNFGCSGIAIYDYLLCEIYRVKGCFMQWDESTAFDVAEYFGIKESLVNEVVKYCGVVGLFNKELLTSGNVLTSLSIQRRYIDASKKYKRSGIQIPKKIRLMEESDIIQEESDIIPDKNDIIPQKGKEKKGKEKNSLYAREDFQIDNYSLGYDELLKEFINSALWQETLIMTDAKFKSVENVKRLMKEFLMKLRKADQFPITIKEAKNRFGGWVEKNINNGSDTEDDTQRLSKIF